MSFDLNTGVTINTSSGLYLLWKCTYALSTILNG